MKQKADIKRKAYLYPASVLVIGTVSGGKPNWSVVAYHGILDSQTILLTIETAHLTTEAIRENREFTVNIPHGEDSDRVEFIGTTSGRKTDKSAQFEHTMVGPNLPIANDYSLSYTCEVVEIHENGGKSYIVAKVKDLYADDSIVQGGKIDIQKLNPLLFDWTGYYTLGEHKGDVFRKK